MATTPQFLLHQRWMQLTSTMIPCRYIHFGNSCSYDLIIKAIRVMNKSWKLYIFIYATLFILRFSKNKQQKKIIESLRKTVKNYIFSLLFMAGLACGIKGAECLLCQLGEVKTNIKSVSFFSILGSASIYFEDINRRGQICYFVFVRAARSCYTFIKHLIGIGGIKGEQKFAFMLIFGILAILYDDQSKNLKQRNMLDKLWGKN